MIPLWLYGTGNLLASFYLTVRAYKTTNLKSRRSLKYATYTVLTMHESGSSSAISRNGATQLNSGVPIKMHIQTRTHSDGKYCLDHLHLKLISASSVASKSRDSLHLEEEKSFAPIIEVTMDR